MKFHWFDVVLANSAVLCKNLFYNEKVSQGIGHTPWIVDFLRFRDVF